MMGTRVLSLWLPYLAIDRRRCQNALPTPARSGLPSATCREDHEDRPLVALCPRAERARLLPGMSRSEALERVPGLALAPDDPAGDRAFLETAAGWCERFTPFVAIDRSQPAYKGGALWLDIGSSAHLAGGEASLLARLLGHFQKMGLSARAAIADHPGSAWAACRFGGDEQRIQPTNGARVALASWPVEALRLNEADREQLVCAGLDRIEHLYALPRRALAARFGDHVATRLDQAFGLVDEPIAIDMPRPAQQAQMIFADPITDHTVLPTLIDRLLHQLCIGLEAAGLGARRLTLALYRVDNSTVTCSIGSDRPCRNRERLTSLIEDRCRDIDLGFGLERAILDAVEIEPFIPETVHWRGLGTSAPLPPRDCPKHDNWPKRDRWLQHLDEPVEPELEMPSFGGMRPAARTLAGGRAATALAIEPAAVARPVVQETLPRPLRLLRQPEPIEAIASLPDEPPVLFRWRQELHKVTSAKGPETVAPDWWHLPEAERPPARGRDNHRDSGSPAARDYFAVEDSEGARFWLFREGRYDTVGSTMPRWFLHGVFG